MKIETTYKSIEEFKNNFDLIKYSQYGVNLPFLGIKKVYQCRNFAKLKFRIQIYYPNFSDDVIVLNVGLEHDHTVECSKRFNSPLVLKQISNYVKKPAKKIVRGLRKWNIEVALKQNTNFKHRIKWKNFSNVNMDYIFIYNWAPEKSVISVQSMMDKPFVACKQFEDSLEI